MAIKYINIFQSKALKNLPKLGLLGLKTNHLATLLCALPIFICFACHVDVLLNFCWLGKCQLSAVNLGKRHLRFAQMKTRCHRPA
jgi:hypothetical protein